MQKVLSSRLSYPDPFKPMGIEFELPEDALVTLKIFNDKGEEVKRVIENEEYSVGIHSIMVIMNDYADGNYLYRLVAVGKTHEYVETKRI